MIGQLLRPVDRLLRKITEKFIIFRLRFSPEQTSGRRRLLIDCTDLRHVTYPSGIPRVTWQITAHALRLGRSFEIEVIPVEFFGETLIAVPTERFRDRMPLSPDSPRLLSKISRNLRRYRDAFRYAMADRPGDLLLCPGHFPYTKQPAIEAFRQRKSRQVFYIIHDLIPITHPEFLPPVSKEWFSEWLQRTFRCADGYLCVSRTTAKTLKSYMRARKIAPSRYAISHFRPGSDPLPGSRPRPTGISARLSEIFRGETPVYLTVSTIEPRKNHACIIEAFEMLWASGSDAALLIVGRVGWMVEALVRRIRTHPEYGRRLLMLNNVTDDELTDCYRKSRALIFASFTEGFGLPLAEAASHDLPVLASDTEIHREVLEDHALFFDPNAPSSLFRLLQGIEEGSVVPGSFEGAAHLFPDWRESTRSILETLLDHMQPGGKDGHAPA